MKKLETVLRGQGHEGDPPFHLFDAAGRRSICDHAAA
jgi:hypothetical protein